MRAFVIENDLDDAGEKKASGSIEENMSVPVPATGEALVRVLRAGVCNTDLELLEGYEDTRPCGPLRLDSLSPSPCVLVIEPVKSSGFILCWI